MISASGSHFDLSRWITGRRSWLGALLTAAIVLLSARGRATAPTWPSTGQWVSITRTGQGVSDPTGDNSGSGSRDIVGTATIPAAYTFADSVHLFFRLRIGGDPIQSGANLTPFGWGCELDTDANPQTYEYLIMVNGVTNPDQIEFAKNTTQTSLDSPGDQADTPPLNIYSALTVTVGTVPPHARTLAAGTGLGTGSDAGGADAFLDFAIDISDLRAGGVTDSTPMRFICGTSNSANSLTADLMAPSGVTTLSGMASDQVVCGAQGCTRCFSAAACGPTCAVCSGATPTCDPYVGCIGCNSDANCATVTGKPHCDMTSHACVECLSSTECTVAIKPVCDATTHACRACAGDGECAGTPTMPACHTSGTLAGSCNECSSGNINLCTAAKPVCLPTTGTCGCSQDADCGNTAWCNSVSSTCVAKLANGVPIPTVTGHTPPLTGVCSAAAGTAVCTSGVCDVDNACGYADGSGVCAPSTSSITCRSGICSGAGVCVAAGACAADSDCSPSQWCNTGVCTAKLANGVAMPSVPGHTPTLDGTCSAAAGTAVCVSTVCDGDHRCGYANGSGSCTTGTAATVCRSGLCATSGANVGKCVACIGGTDCMGTTPACDTATNTCAECTAADPVYCQGTTPVCNDAAKSCAACNGDNGASTTLPCPSIQQPYCRSDGACGKCFADAECGVGHSGPFCLLATGACGNICSTDAQCGGGNWCNDLAGPGGCQTKTVNGQPVPGGTCSPVVAARACISGVCDSDNACGYANGGGACNSTNAGTVCRSGLCSVSGVCLAAGACVVDGDCAANQWCSTGACAAKLSNGTAMPNEAGHQPTLDGQCTTAAAAAVCASGVCDTADHACGYAAGSGPCTSGNAGTLCRSGSCSNAGLCVNAGTCIIDSDCAADKWCNAGACAAKFANGTAIPIVVGHTPVLDGHCTVPAATAVCISAVCDLGDDACGYANGNGSCDGVSGLVVCRSTRCGTTGSNAGKCVACNVNAECPSTTPACNVDNRCVQCTPTSRQECTGTSPVCNATSYTCSPCGGDFGGASPLACPDSQQPFCRTDGACGRCGAHADCIGHAGGTFCDPVAGACSTNCAADSDCGGVTSGRVCHDTSKLCANGCRGTAGNGCPASLVCSSTTSAMGTCQPVADGGIDADAADDPATDAPADGLADSADEGLDVTADASLDGSIDVDASDVTRDAGERETASTDGGSDVRVADISLDPAQDSGPPKNDDASMDAAMPVDGPPEIDASVPPPSPGADTLGGGGLSCSLGHGASSSSFGWLVVVAAMLTARRRRRTKSTLPAAPRV
jgi:hypothetical protein